MDSDYDSAEFLFWSPQNGDKGLTRPSHSVVIAFSGRQMSYKLVRSFESSVSWIAKNRNYQASKLQKMSSRKPCTHEPWILWPAKNCTMCFMTPQKSHFQATKMQKMYSYKCMFPWTVGFTSRKNRIFRSQKWRKSTETKRSTLEQWVTRLGKNRIFMFPKCRKRTYTKTCTHESFV